MKIQEIRGNKKFYILCKLHICQIHSNSSVIDELIRDDVDFALAFIDGISEEIYIYDRNKSIEFLKNASVEKKTGDYRITKYDVDNPINLVSFCEFIDSLI